MDKVLILCAKDSEMMHEFSRRSLHALHDRSLLSVTLSFFSDYLDGNVRKEVDKDALTIRETAAAFESGRPVCDLDLEDIFEKTKEIDKTFIAGLMIPSFSLSVRYSDFADIRIQRIWRIARTVYCLLSKWPDGASFGTAVRNCYTESEFKAVLSEILHLYSLETRMLGDSIRSPFHTSLQHYLESLFQSMESVRDELAAGYTTMIFGGRSIHA
jgi:hypothetical protein